MFYFLKMQVLKKTCFIGANAGSQLSHTFAYSLVHNVAQSHGLQIGKSRYERLITELQVT